MTRRIPNWKPVWGYVARTCLKSELKQKQYKKSLVVLLHELIIEVTIMTLKNKNKEFLKSCELDCAIYLKWSFGKWDFFDILILLFFLVMLDILPRAIYIVGDHSITEVGPQHCLCSFEMRFHSVAQVDLKLLNANNPYTSASR